MAKHNNGNVTFSKAQICQSKKYKNDIDIINALLDDKKMYGLDEVDKIITDFKKGRVK